MKHVSRFLVLFTAASLVSLTGSISAVMTDSSPEGAIYGFYSLYTQSAPSLFSSDATLDWNHFDSPAALTGSVRSLGLCSDELWATGSTDVLAGEGISLFGAYSFDTAQPNLLSLACYRDPIFDDNKPVPSEPASVSSEDIQLTRAIPEPFTLFLLAVGGALLLRKRAVHMLS